MPIKYFALFAFTVGYANDPLTPKEIELNAPIEKKVQRKSPTVKAAFSPFTGKVVGDKVRMRLQPDFDGYIVRELSKSEMVSVIDQEGDYYCVEPPESLKAYIFRSFVLDGVVEGNRVNVRLEPDLEAPIVGHLNSGDRVDGKISKQNRKWLEISPPTTSRFYVAKEFIEYAGGPELKAKISKRKEKVEQLLEETNQFAKSQMENAFEDIDFEKIKEGFLTIVHEYTDFPQKAELAKSALHSLQDQYLEKRIAYLEEKASLASQYNPKQGKKNQSAGPNWHVIEEGLFASWTKSHELKDQTTFYEQQKLLATTVSGVLEVFKSPVKNKPGDYVVKKKNLPVAYVYSTQIDLEDFVGKEVTLLGSPRENYNFAFPAYFVHEVE